MTGPAASPRTAAKPGARSPRRAWLLAAIFLLALVVRLGVIHHFAKPPVADLQWNDAVGWNLANLRGFTASAQPPYVPGIFRSPGYPAFLAVIYKLVGHSYQAAYVAQAVLDALTALLVFLVAEELLTPSIAAWAGLLYALYPYPAMFCGILAQDILLVFGVMLTLLLTVRAMRRPERLRGWLLVGLALGGTVLVKPFLGLYLGVPLLVLALARLPLRRKLANVMVLGVALALVIVPWGVRNYVVFHAFPPLAVGGTGTNLMIVIREIDAGDASTLPSQERVQAALAGAGSNSGGEFVDGAQLIQQERELAARARPELERRWKPYLLVMARHVPRLWITQYAVYDRPLVGRLAELLSFLVLLPGLAGMWLLRKQWRPLLPLYATIVLVTFIYAPYSVEARYTLPARPVMVVFVAAAVCTLLGAARKGRPQGSPGARA